jgi:hypothetical protein
MADEEWDVGVTARVQWRDPLGRFAERIRDGADTAAYDLAKEGAALSAVYAPKRTKRLMRAIKAVKGLVGQAKWVVEGDNKLLTYAASQESGSRAHDIDSHDGGPLANKKVPGVKGRKGFFARSGHVHHPGTEATHFMERARLEIARKAVVVVRRRMPGGKK